ncbi:E3 ubiquitin-protein ligase XIAP-like [Mya arenaria]|uniref:E3 ubiquitin-protein ligase XIAP-like n=1 Tax=Mya arenaria TaxID=6604 RepID=UPI0022DF9980|nr:E3 ubiquitin-protein ligase XIAP-like [Mya arenaria]
MATANNGDKQHHHQKADTTKPTPASLGISTLKPKFQQYALPSKRHESFTEASVPWPEHSPVEVEDLVAAGLVYTGVGDSVRCYHCGGGLRNWETGDDPMEQHAKWYPTCQHVLITKGKNYIHSVEAGENPDKMARRPKVKQTPVEDSASQQQQEAMQAAAEFGYSKENINIAARIFQKRHGASFQFKGADLVTILMEMEDDPDLVLHANVSASPSSNQPEEHFENEDDDNLQSLIEENQKLKDSRNCKICLDSRADVIFLPCGHIVSCPQCSPALDLCPVCRKSIMGLVKARFALTEDSADDESDDE